MKKALLVVALFCCLPLSANAGIVTLDFSTGLEGFTLGSGSGKAISHSTTVGGGSLRMVTDGGDKQNTAILDLDASSLWTEFLNATQFSGTLSYDVTVFADDIVYRTADETPDWFQSHIILHSDRPSAGDNWDANRQNMLAVGTSFTQTVTMNINSNGITADDGDLNSIVSPNWAFLRLGTNNDGGALDGIESMVTYFDNITIVATPEPGSLALFGIALGLGFHRRRR